jgi:hypothetical protein
MTRKDYVLIAESIKGAINYEGNFNENKDKAEALNYLALRLSSAFENDNPRFDRDRFLTACGVK